MSPLLLLEEKAMYSAELEKHKREKEDWKRKAERLEDQASALQVNISLHQAYWLNNTSILNLYVLLPVSSLAESG